MGEVEKRRRGRPATGVTPKRNIRVGAAWDEAADIAEAHGETMTALVTRAIEREIQRLQRAERRTSRIPAARPPADHLPYGERKPYTVADNLDDLHGPTSGVVTLPKHLDWSGKPDFNLDKPARLASMYKVVLAEASTVADLNTWLNRDRLVELWPNLFLPPKVRTLWEARFPELGATPPSTR